jgi:ribosomal protein S14
MHTERDAYLRLGVRQQNLLRLEQLRRLLTFRFLIRRTLCRSLARDAGLSLAQLTWTKREQALLPRAGVATRHNTRCRMSGRTRQAFRDTQTARMQFRQQVTEGRLLGYRLGRN